MERVVEGAGIAPKLRAQARVVEPEIDMKRAALSRPARFKWLADALRVFLPAAAAVGPPMRSVGRELEESWPAREP